MNRLHYFLSFILCLYTFSNLASQNYGALVTGVSSIQTSGTPGEMAAPSATNSAAIAGKSSAAISIASITATNGKMLTVAHEGFFVDGDINLGNNLQFSANAVNWLAPAGKKTILISSLHQEWANPTNLTTFANRAISNGYTVTNSNGAFTAANLTGIGVVVIGNAWGAITQAELDLLSTHLQNGGGILAMGLGWSWGGNANDYPMNKVAALAGQRFIGGTNPSPITTFYPNVLVYNSTQAQNVIDSITTAFPTGLATALQPAGTLQDKWSAANSTLRTIVETSPINAAERTAIYNFYKTQFNKRPNYFKKTVSFNKNTENFFGWSRENIFKIFRDALVLNAANKTDIATTLGLTGRYLDIWNAASVLIADNNALDATQREYLYQLYSLIPTSVHNVGIMTFKDLIDGGTPSLAYANISGVVNSYAINSFSNAIGTFLENQFPTDVAAGTVDIFCAAAPHEVTHVIDAYLSNLSVRFKNRKAQLLSQAGTTDLQYLRSMVTGAFFQASPQEFMASIANQYQVDSKKVFQLARQRFDSNYKEPMNQALFFAEIYATATETYFYNTTLSGVLTRATIPCTKDAAVYINKLTYDGVNYNFVRDPANGNVISYSVGTPNPTNTYCTSKGNLPWQEWIANVQFGTINNTSSKEGYGNFTTQTTTVTKGTSYPLSILQGFSWAADPTNATQQGRAWIDYNQNGTFEDTELVASFTRTTVTANITIPQTALMGATRMRVSLKTTGAPTACEVFDKGEVEDYTVNITDGVQNSTCPNKYSFTSCNPTVGICPDPLAAPNGFNKMLGSRLEDGQYIEFFRAATRFDPRVYLWTGTSVAPPTVPTSFTNATGNWVYFRASGYYETIENQPAQIELNNIWVRIKSAGTASDPLATQVFEVDSISSRTSGLTENAMIQPYGYFSTYDRLRFCNACSSTDRTPYTFTCPTTTVTYNPPSIDKIHVSRLLFNFGISLTDNCGQSGFNTFVMAQPIDGQLGQTYQRTVVVRDTAGNRSTCNLSILVSNANANQPDLTLQNLTVPTPSVQQGQILNFNVDAKNIGTAAATGNFNIKSYLSTDQILDASDYQNGTIPTANFAAGLTQAQVAGAMTVTNAVAAGNYYLILKIDGDNQIAEGNENNNVIVSTNIITVTSINNTTCFNTFRLLSVIPTAGQCSAIETNAFEFGTFQMLGSRIADGFALYLRVPNRSDLNTRLFSKSPPTTTPPANATFRACTGVNWQYFVVQGFSEDERFTNVLTNLNYRVAYFGSETNPDSIIVEAAQSFGSSSTLKSVSKSLNCNPCVTNDRVAPVFNCPTTTVVYSQPFSPDALRIGNIINTGFSTPGTNVQATDNCNAPMIGFQYINNVFWGGVYPISLVAFDSAGNRTACNFNLRVPCSPSVFAPSIANCPTNISLQASAGQTCTTATWTAPTASSGGSPTLLSSNFASGACFPIGTTAVVYTAKDSCGNATTCTFNVTVTGGTTGGSYCASKGIAPWEYWVANTSFNTINNASDKFKDFATLGYSDYTNLTTSVSKGQSYPLSISPGLSWIGNVPNAYCRVWIDFNDNKTFEANELVLEKTNANPLTANVLIPTTAVTGNVRMRVALKFGAYPTACEAFDRGEVEDYTVNITGGTVTPTCLNKYFIYLSQPDANDCTGKFRYFGTIQGTVDFYGATFADGFSFSITNDVSRARKTFQYAKTAPSATPPVGSKFRNCSPPNGWQYFVSNGIGRNERSDNFLDEKVNVRVTYWGNPNKPDSIALELDSTSIFGLNNWATFKSDGFPPLQICNPCFKNDVTPPVITNCPTSEVIYNNTTVFAETILTTANISFTDESCSNSTNSSGRQIQYSIPGVGSTPIFPPGVLTPLSLIAYDSAGNKSVCNFNLRVVLPNANQPDLTLSNLTISTPSVQQGQILNFKVDVKNIGTASATGNFNVKSYLSTDNVLSANDYQDGIIPTANFAAGTNNLQVAGAMTVSSAVAAGQYYLILKIDADNQITESNENNNVVVSSGLITVTGGTTGGADIALSITATPSVYRKFTTHAFKVTAQNIGSQTLMNVKIELKRPALTSNGGSKVASVGSFQDFCPGGIECSEWTIPSLAAGATATLDAPFFILDATTPIVATTKLLSSTPTDANTANNTASVTVNPAPAAAPVLALSRQKPTQYIPLIVQSVAPNPTEGEVVVEVESLTAQEVQFEFSNAMGQTIQSEKRAIEKGTNQVRFDVYEFTQGVYFIQTSVGKGRNAPTKFIKF